MVHANYHELGTSDSKVEDFKGFGHIWALQPSRADHFIKSSPGVGLFATYLFATHTLSPPDLFASYTFVTCTRSLPDIFATCTLCYQDFKPE